MHAKLLCAFLLSLFFAAAATSPASAQQNASVYTSVATKSCIKFERVVLGGGEFAAGYDCPGVPGYRVYRSEFDGRTSIGIGFNRLHAAEQKAADELARNFDCKNGKMHVAGNRGRAIELTSPD
ncbi:MAG: hypothetical protein K2P86_12370 [Xanthobacteraceae bacterium]|jgi:hypothetical protein|nr:hypothetical protein [Xanthobacteraceae bacterium]